jgi:hypothetical protein
MATYSSSTRRLGKYLLLSACFIALDIAGSLLAAAGIYTSPSGYFIMSIFLNIARIGTALCQLSVFNPQRRRPGSVLPTSDAMDPTRMQSPQALRDSPMATQYRMETRRLEHIIEDTKQQAADEREKSILKLQEANAKLVALHIVNKKLVFQLKASLTKAEDANASLQVLVTKLESKNKAERILHHTAKNAMAEA